MPQSISPDIVRTCIGCGRKFHPKARKQNYCGELTTRKCVICGAEFTVTCNSEARLTMTCSNRECKRMHANNRRAESASIAKKICKWCGKEFTPLTARDVYCRDTHYKTCVVCGKQFEIDVRSHADTSTCSDECRYKLMVSKQDKDAIVQHQKETMIAKYGVENPMQLPDSVAKIKATNIKKYGSEWYTQTSEYKERVEATDLVKYGVKHHLQCAEVIEKRVETVQEKYGSTNVFSSEYGKAKIKESNLAKYGVEYASQSQVIQDRITQNNLEKYGVKHPMMLKEYQQKAIDTNIKLYGRRAYTQQHINNITAWYRFIDDPQAYISENYETPPRADELAADLGVEITAIHDHLERNQAKGCVRRARSLMEDDIIQFIRSVSPNCQIIGDDKTVIKPFELDIYLPEHKFAIECNPTCTHNSSTADPWGGDPKPLKYHQSKTNSCEAADVELFHIFGYEWSAKRDIILSMIANKLGADSRTIYARKCKVVNVSGADAMKFLNENHRQGAANSPINLGLEYEGELVSLMTFGKMRGTIGTGKEDLTDCYELVRFCSLLNTSVVGGASKLLKHFVNEYGPKRIRSFSDRAHTSGKLYQVLGFEEIRRSDPGYVWVDVYSDKAYHRVNAQKANIRKFLKDDSIDLSLTEREIMESHGFVRVYDSGTITWEWRKE